MRRLAQGDEAVARRPEDRFDAATLVTDICGFTPLAERLAERGPRGTEQLTGIVEQVFGPLIDLILDADGEILAFTGDAIQAAWPCSAQRSTRAAAAAAAHCAIACRDAIDALPPLAGTKVQLRSGLGLGHCVLLDLRGRGRRRAWLAAGPALVGASRAKRAARAGEILLVDEAPRLLEPHFELQTSPAGWLLSRARGPAPLPCPSPPPSADAATLRRYLPDAVLSRIDADQGGWLAELRTVSAATVHLRDLDGSQRAHRATLQQLVVRVLELLERHGGTLNRLVTGEDGTTLVLVYGFPPRAHEDDPVRAVRTARGVAEHCQTERLAFGIGVTTARAFCGAQGSPRRQDYTVVGASVNLAEGLARHARDEVLCGERTVRESVERLTYEDMQPAQLEGSKDPVRVARPVGERDLSSRHEVLLTGRVEPVRGGRLVSRTFSPALERRSPVSEEASTVAMGIETLGTGGLSPVQVVGRAAEQELLTRRLDQLEEEGRKGVIVIEGGPGIGKSLLGAWLHGEALGRFVPPLLGASEPTTRSDAWHPWRQIFSELLDVEGPRDGEALAQHVRQRMREQEHLASWIPLLSVLLPIGLKPNEWTQQMRGTRRADALGELLAALLQDEAAQHPQLILLEDVHWMDPTSWAFLGAVARDVERVLIVLLTRPMGEGAPPELTELLGRPDCDHRVLDPLDDGQIEELVCSQLKVQSLPQSISNAITERAEGNPFYAEELSYALLESGRIRLTDQGCELADGGLEVDLPDSLQGVLTSRLDDLDPRHGLTAKVASVFGRTFAPAALAQIHPRPEERADLPAHLRALSDAGIAAQEAELPDAPWSFRHAVIQEAAYSLLPFERRRELHAAAARWYAAQPLDDGATGLLLAWHRRRAEQSALAVDALEAAGTAAHARGANQEALDLFDEALEANAELPPDEAAPALRLAAWHHTRADAFVQQGDMFRGKATFEAALEQLGCPRPRSSLGWAWWLLRELGGQLRHRLLPPGQGAHFGAPERARLELTARTLSYWGAAAYFTIEPLHWFLGGLASINIADRLGDDQVAGQALGSFGNVVGALKLQRAARHYFHRCEAIEDASHRVVGHWAEAVFELTYCRWSASRAVVNRGIELSQRTADRYSLGLGHTIRAIDSFQVGRLRDARDDFAQATAMGRFVSNTEHESWGLTFSVPALLALDEGAQLASNLAEAEALIPVLDPFTHVGFHGVRAQVRARAGDFEGALADVAEMLRLHAQHPVALFTHLPGFGGACEAVLAAREAAKGGQAPSLPPGWTLDQLDRKAAGLMAGGALSYLYFRPRRHLLKGTRAWLRGRSGAARRAWRKALRAAEALGMPYEAALVVLEQARLLPPGSQEQGSAVDDARARLEALGADGDLRRLEACVAP